MNDQCFNSEKIIRKPKENSYSRYSARKLKIDFKPIRNIASFACDSPTTEDILNNSFVESTSESPQKSDTGIGLLHHSNYEDKDRQINDNKITSIHETNYFQTPQSVSSRISKLQINKTEHDTPVSSGEHSLMPPKFTPNDSIVLLQQKSALKNQHPVPKQKSIPVISTPHGIKETCFQTPIQKEIPIQKPCKTLFPTNPLSLQTIPEKNQHDNIPNVKQKENICQNNQINPPIKKQINYVSKNPNPITKVNFVLGSVIKLKGREYKIYHKIGQGGSCEVYEAVACEDLAKRAIKCVNLAVNSATAQGYIQEINMLRNLQSSDYVVKMFDCDIIENILFVVMERGDVDLAQLLGNTGNVHLPMILFYWTEMLNAVKCIHDEGLKTFFVILIKTVTNQGQKGPLVQKDISKNISS